MILSRLRHPWLNQFDNEHMMKMMLFCLLFFAEMSAFCVSLTSASSSSLSDTLIFRHGRSRVRHSSEKNHIRWGLKAFDNLTLIDYDYENSNSSNSSNETMADGAGMNTTNQSIFDNDGMSMFSFAYYSTSDRATASGGVGNGWSKISSTTSPSSSSSMNRLYVNNGTAGGWTTSSSSSSSSLSSSVNPKAKLGKKQIMENIRKDVEEGIVYLRTHAHLLQPTESMPSEKLQPLPAPLSTASPANDAVENLTSESSKINEPDGRQSMPPPSFAMSNEMHTNKNMRKRFQNHVTQVKDTIDNAMQNPSKLSHRNSDDGVASSVANQNTDAVLQSIPEMETNTMASTVAQRTQASLKIVKTSFDHVNDEKPNLNGNFVQSLSEQNATGDKFNINLNNKFEYNSQKPQPMTLNGSFAPAILPPASPTVDPRTQIDSKKNHSDKIEQKQRNRPVSPYPAKFQSKDDTDDDAVDGNDGDADNNTNDAILNVAEAVVVGNATIRDNNNVDVSNNLPSNSDDGGSTSSGSSSGNSDGNVQDKVHFQIHSSFNLYSSDDDNVVVVAASANDSEPTENEIIFPSNEDDVDDNDLEHNINFDLTNDNLNDITPAIYRMDAIELAQMNEMDETSRQNRLKMMKGKDVVTEFLQIVERSMDNNCSAGTAVNLGEGVVDQYAQERFRVKADVAVNRANMLTRIFKSSSLAVQASEHILHASVLSMVEFDDDIFGAGHCFDWNQHTAAIKGLYCPFAHRLPDQGILAKDLAAEYHYLGNTSEWFFLARQNAEKVIIKNEQYIKAYHLYTNSTEREVDEILSVKYEDGRWSKPYYDCGGGNIWMLTYTVPFFGYENDTYFFKGTSGIDIDLRRVDIDQCPQRQVIGITQPLNIFAGTDKCKQRTTECVPISGLGFRRGSYKCVCRKGYYFPDTNMQLKYYNGSTLEEEYEKYMLGEVSIYANQNSYECLPCAEGCDACKDASPCVAALNWPMRTIILALACAVIGLLPPAAWFTFRYQHVKVLRAASPALLRVIALGAFFIYCTSIVMYPPPSIYTCTARIWLRELGFSLTYGALMLKTWRISVIFRVRSAKAVKITDAALLKRLGVICGCIGIGLLVRTIVAPPLVIVGRTADDLKAYLCKTDWWDHTFTSMEVLFLAWGVRLCIMVRKAPSEFNESRFISMAIYNEFLLTCFLNVSMLFLQSPANPDLLYIIIFCHTQLTVTLLLALIFGSKVFLVFRSGGKPTEEHIGLGAKSTGVKFISRSHARPLNNPCGTASSAVHYGTIIDGHLTEEQALDEIRDLCAQLHKLRDRMPTRGTAVTMLSTLLEQCKASSKSQMITIEDVKRADSHANGSKEVFKSNKTAHSSGVDTQNTNTTISKTCPKNATTTAAIANESNGVHNVCEQMRCHLSRMNGNATCPTHICTTADVCDVRGVGNEMPVCSSDSSHNARQLSPQSKNHQRLENVSVKSAGNNEQQPSTSSSSSLPSTAMANTKQELSFSNLKLRCMCSEVDKFHIAETADDEAAMSGDDSKNDTAINVPCLQYHRCETPDCAKECYLIQRCCFCQQQQHHHHSNYNPDTTGVGQAPAPAHNKLLSAHSHDEAATSSSALATAASDSIQISQRRHSCSENCNLKLTLSTRKRDKICRCATEHCHNSQSFCDDGAIKRTCHCMRMCDFDLDRIDNERVDVTSLHTVISTPPDVCGLAADGQAAHASTADRIHEKCDNKSPPGTAAHSLDQKDENVSVSNTTIEPTAIATPTTSDTGHSAATDSAPTEAAEDTSNVINNSTNEKRNKTTEKLVLDLNDRSKYTKEVSV